MRVDESELRHDAIAEYFSTAEAELRFWSGNQAMKETLTRMNVIWAAGGESVENAIKIARYYTRRPALITFTNGYHGRSYMGMALSARMNPFKVGFRPFPTEIYRIPFPDAFHRISLDDTKRAFDTLFRSDVEPDQIAAVFFEPVQGEGGYNIAEAGFIR